jgi:hypothetical protein
VVGCKEHTEHINTLCGQSAETLVLNVAVHTVTIRLSSVLVLGSRSVIAVCIFCTTCECFRRVRKIAKKRPLASSRLSVRLSVCPHGTYRLPLGRFSLNFII